MHQRVSIISALTCLLGFASANPCDAQTTYTFQPLTNGPAYGINDRGQVIGLDNASGQGYLYSPTGSYQTFALHDPYGDSCVATALNNLDQFVCHVLVGTHAFLYQNGLNAVAMDLTFQTSNSPTYASYPTGINDAGAIIGIEVNYSSPNQDKQDAVMLVNGVTTIINFPGAAYTLPTGINDSGTIVGNFTDQTGAQHGYIEQAGQFKTLSAPYSKATVVTGLNNIGEVVGTYVGLKGVTRGFVYNGIKYQTINLPSNLTGTITLIGINDEGQIVGNAGAVGFIATPSYFTGF